MSRMRSVAWYTLMDAVPAFPTDIIEILAAYYDEVHGMKRATVAFAGHVDCGKSTLVGQLISHYHPKGKELTAKYEKESTEWGKGSFKFAWWMDSRREERERGISMHWHCARLVLPHSDLTVIDTPGHRDFLPNVLSGLSQADTVVYIITAKKDYFENEIHTFDLYITPAVALGVRQIVIALNQFDDERAFPSDGAAHQRFEECKQIVIDKFESMGVASAVAKQRRRNQEHHSPPFRAMPDPSITAVPTSFSASATRLQHTTDTIAERAVIVPELIFIPVSAYFGGNVFEKVSASTKGRFGWWKGPTLVDVLDAPHECVQTFDRLLSLSRPMNALQFPLRVMIALNYRPTLRHHCERSRFFRRIEDDTGLPSLSSPFSKWRIVAYGMVVSGVLRCGDVVTVTPSQYVSVSGERVHHKERRLKGLPPVRYPTNGRSPQAYCRILSLQRWHDPIPFAVAGELVAFTYLLSDSDPHIGSDVKDYRSLLQPPGSRLGIKKFIHGAVLGPLPPGLPSPKPMPPPHIIQTELERKDGQKLGTEPAVASATTATVVTTAALTNTALKLPVGSQFFGSTAATAVLESAANPATHFNSSFERWLNSVPSVVQLCAVVDMEIQFFATFRDWSEVKPFERPVKLGYTPVFHSHGQSFGGVITEVLSKRQTVASSKWEPSHTVRSGERHAQRLARIRAAEQESGVIEYIERGCVAICRVTCKRLICFEPYDLKAVTHIDEAMADLNSEMGRARNIWHRFARCVLRDHRSLIGVGRVVSCITRPNVTAALTRALPFLPPEMMIVIADFYCHYVVH